MSYSTEVAAFHLLTGVTFGGTALKGARGVRHSKHVTRNPIRADGNKGPTARPVQEIDATTVVRFLDTNGIVAETTAAGSLIATYSRADGTSGTITIANMLASGWDFDGENPEGGMAVQQMFEVMGATLTITCSQ